MDSFVRFIEELQGDPRACGIGAQLKRDGVNLRHLFADLTIYSQGRSMAADRVKRGKQHRAIINRAVRENGLRPEYGRWLLDRGELAHATNGLTRVHNVDALAGAVIYTEAVTRRKLPMSSLAFLVECANRALNLKPFDVDPETIGRELRRHKEKNGRFLEILKADILDKL